MEGSYRFVLTEDGALIREELRRVLRETADLKVVEEARDGLEALKGGTDTESLSAAEKTKLGRMYIPAHFSSEEANAAE